MAILVIASLCIALAVWASLLRLGLKLVKAERVSTGRLAVVTIFLPCLLPLISYWGLLAIAKNADYRVMVIVVGANLLAILCISTATISFAFRVRILMAALIWFISSLSIPIVILLLAVLSSPLTIQAFSVASNSMAPNLVGTHLRGKCPECGSENFCSPDALTTRGSSNSARMICTNYHVQELSVLDLNLHHGDRVIVNKLKSPRRWDLIAFLPPSSISTQPFLMRVVGLPGETIHIEDGAVWADGERLVPPESLKGIRYTTELPNVTQVLWGSTAHKATLKANEYFVLGDFSKISYDSRLWPTATVGQSPFAVPASSLIGVATHLYWPPHRWRSF